jgi:phosphinothricin acetyltransferase
MNDVMIRAATQGDLPALTEIYNHYVVHTSITFDLEPFTVDAREAWFDAHVSDPRYRLFAAVGGGRVVGYASTSRFRPKAAYDTTVEASVYCNPEAVGRGVGRALYEILFQSIAAEDIHRIVAGVTLPNAASVALHARFGFKQIGTFSANGRKFGRYWDVAWYERPLALTI